MGKNSIPYTCVDTCLEIVLICVDICWDFIYICLYELTPVALNSHVLISIGISWYLSISADSYPLMLISIDIHWYFIDLDLACGG